MFTFLFDFDKINFMSNIFTFGNRNRKLRMRLFLFLNLYSNNLLIYLLFKSLKTVLLYLIKYNCCIYFYIFILGFFTFNFWFINKHLGLMGHPLELRNPSLLKAKINDIFKTSLLLFPYWLLELIQYNILLK